LLLSCCLAESWSSASQLALELGEVAVQRGDQARLVAAACSAAAISAFFAVIDAVSSCFFLSALPLTAASSASSAAR
jgi:hypothetical protein